MYYVELQRARRVLFWYTISVFGIVAIIAISVLGRHGNIEDVGTIPLSELLIACTVGAYVVATIVSTGLVSESATLPITWTRPVPRDRIAWTFVAIDVAAILAGYLVIIAAVLLCLAIFGLLGYVQVTPGAWSAFVLGLGSAVMWYALTSAASSRLSAHGVRVAALSWFAFLVIGGVWAAPLPAPLHAVLTALNYLNPMAYINGVVVDGHVHASGRHAIMLSQTARIALEWIISAVAVIVAVRLWSTREA
jgi:hypothetical protein